MELSATRHTRAALDGVDEALAFLKHEFFLGSPSDLENLEQLQTCLQRWTTWISNKLSNLRDDGDEDAVSESLALELETNDDEYTPPPATTTTTTTTPNPAKNVQPAAPRQTRTRTTDATANSAKQPNSDARHNATPSQQKLHRHGRTQHSERTSTTRPSKRLVVWFPGQSIPLNVRPHPATFRDELNNAINMNAVESIQYSRMGQLILQTRDPYTAAQLAALSHQLWPIIQAALTIRDTLRRPIFEPDDAWSRVVVNQVPIPVWDGKTGPQVTQEAIIHELCHTNSLPADSVRRVHWLCPKDKVETRLRSSTATSPAFISIMVALQGPRIAALIRQRGAVILGAHCRVTNYKERKG